MVDAYIKIQILHKLKLFNLARAAAGWVQSYDPDRRKFFRQFMSDTNNLVFDIGTNVGQFTEIFLRLGAKVICVEPQNACYRFLQSRYKNCKRVIVINKALDSEEGIQKKMYISKANALSSLSSRHIEASKNSGRYEQYQWEEIETVLTTTLDKLIDKFGIPAFCKIDVEGYELSVLKGLTQPMPYLSFEISPESFEEACLCIDYLDDIGKMVFNFSGEAKTMKFADWIKLDAFKAWLNTVPNGRIFGDIYIHFLD